MDPADFQPGALAVGTRATLALDITPLLTGGMLQVPLQVIRGGAPGPTLVVLGGVHGDEYEGMAATRAVFQAIDPAALRGVFIGLPVCNPPAFAAGSRVSPIDGLNLARTFPGRPDGTVSERIAHVITTTVTSWADFLIDLHSSGSRMAMPLLVGYYQDDGPAGQASRQAALRFGLPVIWGHATVGPGRSLTEPHGRGVPWLYTECPSGGWLHQEIADAYAGGVLNVMRHLRMLPGEAPLRPITHDLAGEGDVDQSLVVPVAGFLTPRVNLLDVVAAGDLLGVIEDLSGRPLAEMRAPRAGRVVLRRETPVVAAGEIAFLIT